MGPTDQGDLFAPNDDEDPKTWVMEDPWDHGCYFIEHRDEIFIDISSYSASDDDIKYWSMWVESGRICS